MHQSELADVTFKGTPTLTRIVDLLCEKGLAERVMDPTDRRKFKVNLTQSGHQKVEEMIPEVSKIRKAAWVNLLPEDFKHFKYVLETIYKNLAI
jgi:DNA-binding MarR family transcriptional regulator